MFLGKITSLFKIVQCESISQLSQENLLNFDNQATLVVRRGAAVTVTFFVVNAVAKFHTYTRQFSARTVRV